MYKNLDLININKNIRFITLLILLSRFIEI